MTTDPYAQHQRVDVQGHHAPRPGRRGPFRAAAFAAFAVVAILSVVLLVIRGGTTPSTPEDDQETPTLLEAAKDMCSEHTSAVRIGDHGTSMTIDRVAAEEDAGASITELMCILAQTDTPDAVISHMDSTRALDGRQQATWDSLTASWTYHPKSGLNVILQETG